MVTIESLDYEDIKEFQLRIYVTDSGDLLEDDNSTYSHVTELPSDHWNYVDVTVTVLDINDNYPIFTDNVTEFNLDVAEEESSNTTVGVVKATDLDSGPRGSVRYSISGVGSEKYSSYNLGCIMFAFE